MKIPFFRSPHNYDMNEASDASGLKCKDVSLAQQSFKDECDINVIIKRFGLDGPLPSNVRAPMYGDFTDLSDFADAMNATARAKEAFDEMPARVRARFDNDTAKFVDFCSDEKNADEMASLGLVTPQAFDRLEADRKARELVQARALVEAAAPRVDVPVTSGAQSST